MLTHEQLAAALLDGDHRGMVFDDPEDGALHVRLLDITSNSLERVTGVAWEPTQELVRVYYLRGVLAARAHYELPAYAVEAFEIMLAEWSL